MSHTKGKITFNKAEGWLQGSDGKRIGTTCLTVSRDDDENRANARRLVACWNACSSYDTEHLETECLDKRERWEIMVDLQDFEKRSWADRERITSLEKERDELLKALREERSAWEELKSFSEMRKMHDACDAILARYQESKS